MVSVTTPIMEPHNRLKSWLEAAGIAPAEMARRCEYDRSNMHKIINGTGRPSLNLAARIESVTGGTIPASAWATDQDIAA